MGFYTTAPARRDDAAPGLHSSLQPKMRCRCGGTGTSVGVMIVAENHGSVWPTGTTNVLANAGECLFINVSPALNLD